MKINLDKIPNLTPKPKRGGAAERRQSKKKPRKRSQPLYICEQVIYHLILENSL